MKAIYAEGPPPIATFSYDLNGNRLTLALNNGVNTDYGYDAASRLTNILSTRAYDRILKVSRTIADRRGPPTNLQLY